MSDLVWGLATALLLLGLSTACWAGVGISRRLFQAGEPVHGAQHRITGHDVAVLIAAHNEEAVIESTLCAVRRLLPARQVFVVSDASTDRTVELARQHGVQVLDLRPNRGKAAALVAGLQHFALTRRFQVVMILDADTIPAEDYLVTALPMFDDPTVAAVAGRATTRWSASPGWISRILLAHRERVYVLFQTLLKYGQAARYANAVAIVPGFASLYRADVLAQLDIAAAGLAIEDYNMTFEIHAKRLGRVAFDPSAARAMTQDPDNLADYMRQVGRWNLGFWQTLRRHRPQWRLFWLAVSLFAIEVVLSSVLVIFLAAASLGVGIVLLAERPITGSPLVPALLGVVVFDLVATLYVAMVARRPGMLLMAPAFIVVRVIDAVLCLRSLAQAMTRRSSGVWRSPARRPAVAAEGVSSRSFAEKGDQLGA